MALQFADIKDLESDKRYNNNRAWSICDVKNMGSVPSSNDYYPDGLDKGFGPVTPESVPTSSENMRLDLYRHKRPTFDVAKPYKMDTSDTMMRDVSELLLPSQQSLPGPLSAPQSSPVEDVQPSDPSPIVFPKAAEYSSSPSKPDASAQVSSAGMSSPIVYTHDAAADADVAVPVAVPAVTDTVASQSESTLVGKLVYVALYLAVGILIVLLLEQFTRVGVLLRWHF